jgi:cell division protein FtsB
VSQQYPPAEQLAEELEEIKARLDDLEQRMDQLQGGADLPIPSLERGEDQDAAPD